MSVVVDYIYPLSATSESTLKQSTTCGVSNTMYFTFYLFATDLVDDNFVI